MRRLLVFLAVSVAAMLFGTQTAWAGVTRSVSFTTSGRAEPGYATATLKVTWYSATQADSWVTLTDVCPGNGLGVYPHMRLQTVGGAWHQLGTASYTGGCGDTVSDFAFAIAGGYGRVAHFDGRLCEEDHNGNKPSICTDWKAIDNPYT